MKINIIRYRAIIKKILSVEGGNTSLVGQNTGGGYVEFENNDK